MKKTESFYILGYLLGLVIKSRDLKKKIFKIWQILPDCQAKFTRFCKSLPNFHQTYLYMIFSGQRIGENSLEKETLVQTGNPFVQIPVMMISSELV
jgi:hypothetical protein